MGIFGDLLGSSSKNSGYSNSLSTGRSGNESESSSSGTSFSNASGNSTSSQNSRNETGNRAYDALFGAYGGQVQTGLNAGSQIERLLGLRGGSDQLQAQNAFRQTPGYQFLLNEGRRGVEGSYAGQGVLQSGAAAKALQARAMGIANQTYGDYMDRLIGQQNAGMGAGQLISGAGGYGTGFSQGSSQSSNLSSSGSQNVSDSTSSGWSTNDSVTNAQNGGKSGSGLLGQILSL